MINRVKKIINLLAVMVAFVLFLGCEPEEDGLGLQFFENNKVVGSELVYGIVAYNMSNNDTVRSDARVLQEIVLGVFSENNFGKHQSAYVSQLRPSVYSPNFGTNAVLDSVILQIKPKYYEVQDSVKITESDYIFNDVESKKVVNSYIVKKYGNTKVNGGVLNIKISEITDFLGGDEKKYSNQRVNEGVILGRYLFDGKITSVKINKKSDKSELLNRTPSIRIPLDKNFFQKKIMDKQGSFQLADAASFIRYFRGLKISVENQDGYFFYFDPSDVSVIMHYTTDEVKNDTTQRVQKSYNLNLGGSNAYFVQSKFVRSERYTRALSSINGVKGDSKLYLQGMGGSGAEVKIPSNIVEEIRQKYHQDGMAILSAKIRLYSDDEVRGNSYAKPLSLLVKEKGKNSFISDIAAFSGLSSFQMVTLSDKEAGVSYYDVNITSTLKNVIEKETSGRDVIIQLNVGEYLRNKDGILLGQDYNNRSSIPDRIVLVGSGDTKNQNKVTLRINYIAK